MAVQVMFLAACLLIGAALVVAGRHYLSWREDPKRRLLPLHIWCIALSYVLLVAALAVQTQVLVRWWHWWFYVPAVVLGLVSMWAMTKYQTKR